MTSDPTRDPVRDEIRSLVRAAIRDALPQIAGASSGKAIAGDAMAAEISKLARGAGGSVAVRIANNEDLLAFAKLLITCGDPVAQVAVLEGKVRLDLESGPVVASGGAVAKQVSSSSAQLAGGVIGERQVNQIAKTQSVLVISKQAVVTPLAQERARKLGLEIVRKEP